MEYLFNGVQHLLGHLVLLVRLYDQFGDLGFATLSDIHFLVDEIGEASDGRIV